MASARLPLVVAGIAVAALIGVAVTFAVVATGGDDDNGGGRTVVVAPGLGMMGGDGLGGMMGTGMMGGFLGTQGEIEPVTSMEAAVDRVSAWLETAGFSGFRPAEVMSFSNGYYVAVDDTDGQGAFELLVDPATGWISPEPGPNMMWNTTYGMLGGRYGMGMGGMMGGGFGMGMMGGVQGAADTPLSPEEAQEIANRWLAQVLPGETAESARALPGYYTLDTERDGRVQGMLSVNSSTGAVWYHVWHGSFIDELEL